MFSLRQGREMACWHRPVFVLIRPPRACLVGEEDCRANPATPQPSRAPLPDSAASGGGIGKGGTGRGPGKRTDLACKSHSPTRQARGGLADARSSLPPSLMHIRGTRTGPHQLPAVEPSHDTRRENVGFIPLFSSPCRPRPIADPPCPCPTCRRQPHSPPVCRCGARRRSRRKLRTWPQTRP